jgi:hypothetical protein
MGHSDTKTQVSCYSGDTYAKKPTTLTWQGEKLIVTKILSEWKTPDEKVFVVQAEDDHIFKLIYDLSSEKWQIAETGTNG